MPEIPEMEHYRQLLSQTVLGKQIELITIQRPKSINLDPAEFTTLLTGEMIIQVSRRAKLLLLHLQGGRYLLTHMMLDGRLYYGPANLTEGLPGKAVVILDFTDGNSLYFCDLRLGYLHLLTAAELEQVLAELGVEPLDSNFTLDLFSSLLKGRRGAIKPLLLDQKVVCGIGNAYSNEILFTSRILPERKLPSLQTSELHVLWETIPQVLQTGINNGGYLEEPYSSWDNTSGGQNAAFLVYDRGGQSCKVCSTPITKTKLQGRWTYYCKRCQN